MSRCVHWYDTPRGGTCLKEILRVCAGDDGFACYEAPDEDWAFAWRLNRVLQEYAGVARLSGSSSDPAEANVRRARMEELREAVGDIQEDIRQIAQQEAERLLGE